MVDSQAPSWPVRPAVFLDLDGTLLDLAEEPAAVVLTGRLKRLLAKLPQATDGAFALITGRTLRDVDRLLAPMRFAIAGVHGLERRDAAGRSHVVHLPDPALGGAREQIAALAADHEGLILEDKQWSLAVHYRKRPELEPAVLEFFACLADRLPNSLGVLRGQKAVEIKPVAVDKGEAIRSFMSERPFAGREAVFVGDDVSDESGFAVVNALEGVSVKVGPGHTAAHWRLSGVDAVLGWIEELAGTSA